MYMKYTSNIHEIYMKYTSTHIRVHAIYQTKESTSKESIKKIVAYQNSPSERDVKWGKCVLRKAPNSNPFHL